MRLRFAQSGNPGTKGIGASQTPSACQGEDAAFPLGQVD